MKLLVVSDAHLVKCVDGTYWCKTAVHGYVFWSRYLSVFEKVKVVSRVEYMKNIDKGKYTRVDGEGIEICELPFVRGAKGFLIHYFSFLKEIKAVIKDEECAIFRLPSIPAFMVLRYFKRTKRPYAVEVVADPYDAYSTNLVARIVYTMKLKRTCAEANGVSYVTKYFLQERYPSRARIRTDDSLYFENYYSSIDLDEDFFSEPKKYAKSKVNFTIIHTASSINNDNKGHTTLLNAFKILKKKGLNVKLICIGDGDKRNYYEKMASDLEISEDVEFVGLFSSKYEVRNLLINSDLFVFPTRAEGLPRAVIEAMAVGLPCLSTAVAGIPELLEGKYMFAPDDINGFANEIIRLIQNCDELEVMSCENIENARRYRKEELTNRRDEFYRELKKVAEAKYKVN
ncbi:glycosyltransferase [Clostridium grantii]|uniref:Glycosyltransferase involved in cell wall bisynthesis n=1 Tax=Clostridium grantii DSM 8605 TaxID=1121316 RepID=A0A1M5T8J2_9CLOT|nr:glycosyltransferase [Clostridium grantii]SHH47018.1 Glycosyltransferase involved in cell wall bisynthesis [Clostridium grantii DSM 8605]